MSACGVCGKGQASDAYGRCSKCSAAIYGGDGRGTPKRKAGTSFGGEKEWLAERKRTARQETVVERRGEAGDRRRASRPEWAPGMTAAQVRAWGVTAEEAARRMRWFAILLSWGSLDPVERTRAGAT